MLATGGMFLFLYGMVMTTPVLRNAFIPVPASLETIAPLHTAAPLRAVPESVFFVGTLLVTAAATIDVWKRLGRL